MPDASVQHPSSIWASRQHTHSSHANKAERLQTSNRRQKPISTNRSYSAGCEHDQRTRRSRRPDVFALSWFDHCARGMPGGAGGKVGWLGSRLSIAERRRIKGGTGLDRSGGCDAAMPLHQLGFDGRWGARRASDGEQRREGSASVSSSDVECSEITLRAVRALQGRRRHLGCLERACSQLPRSTAKFVLVGTGTLLDHSGKDAIVQNGYRSAPQSKDGWSRRHRYLLSAAHHVQCNAIARIPYFRLCILLV